MQKTEFIAAVAEECGFSKREVKTVYEAMYQVASKNLVKGEPLKLVGFGTFTIVKRAKRKGRNPLTNEPMTIPASKVVKFRCSDAIKSKLNKKKK